MMEEQIFTCDVCSKKFTHEIGLNVHLRTHAKERRFVCDVCQKVFAHQLDLSRHLSTHIGEKPFKCRYCKKVYSNKLALRIHLNSHRGMRQLPCHICQKVFSRHDSLKKHILNHRSYECVVCEDVYYSKSLLNAHLQTHASEEGIQCDLCKKTFSDEISLELHFCSTANEDPVNDLSECAPGHSKNREDFQCDDCGKMFTHKTDLDQHICPVPNHEDSVIDAPSSSKSEKLTVDHQISSKGNSFQCEDCGKMFTHETDLDQHICSVANHEDSIPDASSNTKSENLAVDHQTSSKGNRFLCEDCGEIFIHKTDLDQHICPVANHEDSITDAPSSAKSENLAVDHQTGSKDNSFWCDVCEEAFSCRRDLDEHRCLSASDKNSVGDRSDRVLSVSVETFKERELQCAACDKVFSCRKDLDEHSCPESNYENHNQDLTDTVMSEILTASLEAHDDKKKGFCCAICNKSFNSKYGLDYHFCDDKDKSEYARVSRKNLGVDPEDFFTTYICPDSGQKMHACKICHRSFTFKSNLRRHFRIHSGVKPYKCKYCKMPFYDLSHFYQHLRALKRKNTCRKAFLEQKNFRKLSSFFNNEEENVRSPASRLEVGKFWCNTCNKVFPCRRDFSLHFCSKINKDSAHDEQCNDERGSSYHLQASDKEREFACDACKRDFSNLKDLIQHVCTKVKHSVSNQLDNRTSQNSSKVQHSHAKKLHFSSNLKNYACKRTFNKSNVRPLRIKVTSFACKFCQKTFSDQNLYDNHLLTHKIQKTFRNLHGKSLEVKNFLVKKKSFSELFQSLKTRKLQCTDCKESFSCKSEMNKHCCSNSNENSNSDGIENIRIDNSVKASVDERGFSSRSDSNRDFYSNSNENYYGDEPDSMEIENSGEDVQASDEEKDFDCNTCEEKFSCENDLNDHVCLKSALFDTSETIASQNSSLCTKTQIKENRSSDFLSVSAFLKPFTCGECERTFTEKANLRRHFRMHTGERKPFECKFCQKTFNDSTHYIHHFQSHKRQTTCRLFLEKKLKIPLEKLSLALQDQEKVEVFFCDACRTMFSSKKCLNQHPCSGKTYVCKFCEKSFTNLGHYNNHVLAHKLEKKREAFLGKSENLHTEENKNSQLYKKKSYICRICKKIFSCKLDFEEHVCMDLIGGSNDDALENNMTVHSAEPRHSSVKGQTFSCDDCNEKFSHKTDLLAHVCNLKSENLGSNISGAVTSQTLAQKPFLYSYKTFLKLCEEQKTYVCHICNQTFLYRHNLRRHIRIHTGVKPFKCIVCEKSFTDKSNFERHLQAGIRSHTCRKVYNLQKKLQDNLSESEKQHSSVLHEDINPPSSPKVREKTNECGVCGKKFLLRKSLDVHLRIHTGERPYKCHICNKGFPFKLSFTRHFRSHTDSELFMCDVCNQSFSSTELLNEHRSIHSKEKPLVCYVRQEPSSDEANSSNSCGSLSLENHLTCAACQGSFSSVGDFNSHVCNNEAFGASNADSDESNSGNLSDPDDEERIVCDFCEERFPCETDLKLHLHTHFEQTKLICPECGKEFSDTHELNKHILRHTKHC